MKISILKFLKDAGIEEKLYPGKRLVKQCPQHGEYKSHSVVVDWRDPGMVRLDVKPGLSGKDLDPKILKKYPVSFQAPTFVEIELENEQNASQRDEADEGEESSSAAGGKSSGGGGRRPARDKEQEGMNYAFASALKGSVPDGGVVKKIVVMGMQIGERAFDRVMDMLASQIAQARIHATDILAEGGKFITRYTPPSFLKPKGDETAQYRYDRSKNEPMFGAIGPK